MMVADHIHFPEDGRGRRRVFLNGKLMHACCYADTKKGFIDCYDEPPKLDRWRKRIIKRRYRGKVTVESIVNGS